MLNNCKYVFFQPIIGKFIKREKRFFSYFQDDQNNKLVAHCVNTGKMADILIKDSESILSSKSTGKLAYTWEAVNINNTWIGTNTSIPNKLVAQLIQTPAIAKLKEEVFKQEVTFKFPEKTYRADFASDNTVIEVKHVHWKRGDIVYFPDCIAERSSEQMNILIKLKEMGKRVIVIYIVQRNDVEIFSVDPNVDSLYYKQVQNGKKANIEFFAFNCTINHRGIYLNKQISILI